MPAFGLDRRLWRSASALLVRVSCRQRQAGRDWIGSDTKKGDCDDNEEARKIGMAAISRRRVQALGSKRGGNRGCLEAEWLPLIGISYDPNDDIVEVALEGLDHLIPKPREIYLENGGAALASIEIVDADGVKQIIKLKDQLMLPPPGSR